MTSRPDEPTEILDDDDEEPTEHLDPETGDEPTEHLEPGTEEAPTSRLEEETGQTEELRTRRLAENPPPPPSVEQPPPADDSRQRGIAMLFASILAALILIGIYIAAGGLDYKPSAAADPCDARAWTDPGNLEEAAQQFAFSAVDGAACEMGVSREELTRALADPASREAFQEDNDLSDSEVEDAIRAGLDRAIDDAEDAGVINGLTVTGLHAAVRFLPVDQMIPVIEDASGFLSGEDLGGIGGVLNGVIDSMGSDGNGDSGATGDTGATEDIIPDGLGNQLEQGLRENLPPGIEKQLPDDLQKRAEQELNNLINP